MPKQGMILCGGGERYGMGDFPVIRENMAALIWRMGNVQVNPLYMRVFRVFGAFRNREYIFQEQGILRAYQGN